MILPSSSGRPHPESLPARSIAAFIVALMALYVNSFVPWLEMHTADLYRISLGQGSSVVNASSLTTALCVEKEQKPCILVMNPAGCLSDEDYSRSTG